MAQTRKAPAPTRVSRRRAKTEAFDRSKAQWLFLSRPPRSWAMSGWALLPLRAFLGITFCFAGLQKLANPNFFNANSPSSIQAQLIASERISPLHSLLGHFLQFATPIGILIALGELAVGIGALLGLWTRIAALGGIVLSLTLFLTVSFHAKPYFTGADIVFLFAWTPLLIAGSGGVLSLDGVIESWTKHEAGLGPPNLVPVRFEKVQESCGQYNADRCAARHNAPCDPKECPFLRGGRASVLSRGPDDVDRRTLVLGGAVAAGAAAVALVGAGAVAGIGRLVGGAPSPGGRTTNLPGAGGTAPTPSAGGASGAASTTAPAGGSGTKPAGTAIGPAKDVPTGGAASFSDPSSGDPSIVLQQSSGSFVAYDAVCPHAGCTVGYSQAAKLLVCPCHGSEFDPSSGNVLTGPAASGLRQLKIAEGPDGQLYVRG